MSAVLLPPLPRFSPKLSAADLAKLKNHLPNMPLRQKREVLALLEQYAAEIQRAKAQNSFLEFIRRVYPGYIIGPHHRKLAKIFEDICDGKLKRVIVNIAPRFGKSELISYLAPSYYFGRFPNRKVIMASHTADLAIGFGRRVKNLIETAEYADIFPGVELQADSKAAGRWGTNHFGEYFAVGTGGAVAGRGGDLIIIDDPHSEQEAKQGKPEVFNPAWEWFQSGPLQRLMPNGAVIIVMTRWSKLDLTGQAVDHYIKNAEFGADEWYVVEFPAILNEHSDEESSLWPDFWSLEELRKKRANMEVRYWTSQYQQDPVSEEGALIKREHWNVWEGDEPPKCKFIIMTLDAAQEENNRADYNACQVWGVFDDEEKHLKDNVILLNAFRKRMKFPALKARMYDEYAEWQPDSFIVEKKSNGAALVQEMRSTGIPVGEFTPGKGSDKVARVNSVTDIFESGMVWAPDTRWAHEVVEECNDFPAGKNDDHVDACTLALMRIRKGGFITLPTDEKPDPLQASSLSRVRRQGYY